MLIVEVTNFIPEKVVSSKNNILNIFVNAVENTVPIKLELLENNIDTAVELTKYSK